MRMKGVGSLVMQAIAVYPIPYGYPGDAKQFCSQRFVAFRLGESLDERLFLLVFSRCNRGRMDR